MEQNTDIGAEALPKNCWEVKDCAYCWDGTDEGLASACPASCPGTYNGINRGRYGGRCCWAVSCTLLEGNIQGDMIEKLNTCLECSFLMRVHEEEGSDIVLVPKKSSGITV